MPTSMVSFSSFFLVLTLAILRAYLIVVIAAGVRCAAL